jgi:hypothetical protein
MQWVNSFCCLRTANQDEGAVDFRRLQAHGYQEAEPFGVFEAKLRDAEAAQ